MRSASDVEFNLHRPMGDQTYTNFIWAFDGTPQEMAVRDGRVVERGSTVGRQSAIVDLGGARVAPAFIDSHCHILPAGLDMQKLHLGVAATPDEVLDLVRARDKELEPGQWLMAVHYDQTKFPGGKHLTKHDLDAISKVRPILLRHSNGHASIANTGTLLAAKVSKDTRDPKGGTYLRDPDGAPNGILLERAHDLVTATSVTPTVEQMVDAILAVSAKMAEFGIVEATDMMTGRYDLGRELEAYRLAAERGCPIRTRLCIQWATLFDRSGEYRTYKTYGSYREGVLHELAQALDGDRCAIWGAKIFADGAIGSATAAIHGTFTSDPTTSGALIYEPSRLKKMVQIADHAGWRVAIHSIGDRSTDLVMDAYEALEDPTRHRIEHAMILSDAQIDRMAKLGCHCTMQPEFLARFGHSYKHHLGVERASMLKRYRSVRDAGIPLSFSSDRPIVSGDPWVGVSAASERPEGFEAKESLAFEEALYAYTTMGSVANSGPRHALMPGDRAEFMAFQLMA